MKKRQRRKILKIVARQINSGDFTKLRPVHFRCMDRTLFNFIVKKYLNVFRPWWYGQLENWPKLSLSEELLKHEEKVIAEFGQVSGIDMEKYQQYFDLNHRNAVLQGGERDASRT